MAHVREPSPATSQVHQKEVDGKQGGRDLNLSLRNEIQASLATP